MNQEEQNKKIGQLIAKCWSDESFKQKLLVDPAATLKAEGVELPADLSLVAVENTDKVFHLVIPSKPTDLSDADLDRMAGGNNVFIPFAQVKNGNDQGQGQLHNSHAAYDWPPGLSF